jgi:hypothetical protein
MAVKWRMEPCRRRYVVVHETGHLFGLPHSPDPASVMYPYLGAEQLALHPEMCP